jgi:hypothetical protein
MVKDWLRANKTVSDADIEAGRVVRHYFNGFLLKQISGKINVRPGEAYDHIRAHAKRQPPRLKAPPGYAPAVAQDATPAPVPDLGAMIDPDIRRALGEQNIETPGGRVQQSGRELVLRTLGRMGSVEEFSRLIVADPGGQPVYLSQVASRFRLSMSEDQKAEIIFGSRSEMILLGMPNKTKTCSRNCCADCWAVSSALALIRRTRAVAASDTVRIASNPSAVRGKPVIQSIVTTSQR